MEPKNSFYLIKKFDFLDVGGVCFFYLMLNRTFF